MKKYLALALAFSWILAASAEEPKNEEPKNGQKTFAMDLRSFFGSGLTFSPDGKKIVWTTLRYDKNAKPEAFKKPEFPLTVWDVAAGKKVLESTELGAEEYAFSPDGKTLACIHEPNFKGSIRFLDAATFKPKDCPIKELPNRIASLLYSPDGKYLAISTKFTNTVLVANVADGKIIHTLEMVNANPVDPNKYSMEALAFRSDGKYLAAARYGKAEVVAWDLEKGEEVARFNVDGMNSSIGFHGDRLHVATCEEAVAWSIAENKAIYAHQLDLEFMIAGERKIKLPPETALPPSRGVAMSHDGRFLVRWSQMDIQLVDMLTGKSCRTVLDAKPCRLYQRAPIHQVTFAPGDDVLLVTKRGKFFDSFMLLPTSDVKEHVGKEVNDKQLGVLLSDLLGEDSAKSYDAASILIAVPDQSIPKIEELLIGKECDYTKASRLLYVLEKIGNKKAHEVLTQAANEGPADIRAIARDGLARISRK